MSTSDKLNYLIETKNEIKTAIQNKGVQVSDTDTFRSYAGKIDEIQTGTTPSEEWQPEPDWWDIETILANDTEDYPYKAIFLISDELDDNILENSNGNYIRYFNKYKLSDGQIINNDIFYINKNTIDTSKDKPCSKGYKTRYIIAYSNVESINYITPKNTIYAIFDKVKHITAGSIFSGLYLLQALKFKNGAGINGNTINSGFSNDSNLEKIEGLDFSNFSSFNTAFYLCSKLDISKFNISSSLNLLTSFINYTDNIWDISNFDISNFDNFPNISNSINLKKIYTFDKNKVYTLSASNALSYCFLIESFDIKIKPTFKGYGNIFTYCPNLKYVKYIDLSELSYSRFNYSF